MAEGIAFIGFGEAARAIAQGWRQTRGPAQWRGASVAAWDIALAGSGAPAIRRACAVAGVTCADSRAAALAGARRVLCLVTADQAVAAARAAAADLVPGTVWYDGNSCAPDSKRAAAAIIEAAGGTYADLAIMAPIHPQLHRTPLLVAGPRDALPFLDAMGMVYRWQGSDIGAASAVKINSLGHGQGP